MDEIISNSDSSTSEIRLKTRYFSPIESKKAGVKSAAASEARHVLIQLEEGQADATLGRLAKVGIKILEYVPVSAVSAKVPAGVDPLAVPGVRWVGRLQPVDKLSPAIDERPGTKRLVVDLHPGVSAGEAAKKIVGASPETRVIEKLPPHSLLVETDDAGAAKISQIDGVSYLFPAAKEVSSATHRCAGAMTVAGPVAFYALRGEGWEGQGANSVSLTYRLDASLAGTPGISAADQRSEIVRGLTAWSQHVSINWSQTSTPNLPRSLEIFWGSDADNPFDGREGTLAYCYFPSPPNPETVAGNMHFDPAENWTVGQAGTDLFSVAMHEAGHGIGIDHSDSTAAVMYPYYRFTTALNQDDINAAQALYARAGTGGGGGGGTPGSGDAFEPDNGLGQAKQIASGAPQSRSIRPVGDIDYASFQLTSAGDIDVATSGVSGDTRLFLYDSSGNQIASNDDSDGSYFSRITRANLPAGTYYILVDEYGNNGVIDSYQISLNARLLTVAGDTFEEDNQTSAAKEISAGETQVRSIRPAGDLDYAYFTLTQPSEVAIETSGATGDDTRMWLSSSSLSTLEFNDDGGEGLYSRIDRLSKDGDELPAGTYYVLVNEYSNAKEIPAYNLTLTSVPLAGSNGDDAYEENDEIYNYYAPDFNWERTMISGIEGPGVQRDNDWYEIDVWPPGYERVVAEAYFTAAEGDIDLALYDSRGRLLAVSEEAGRDREAISYRVPKAGYYYLRVYYGNAGNSYDLYWDDLERSSPGIDAAAPTIRWSTPRNGTVLRRTTLFSGTATDNTKVESVYYRIGSGDFEEADYVARTKKWSFQVDPSQVPRGRVFPIEIFAEDSLGNTSALQRRLYSAP